MKRPPSHLVEVFAIVILLSVGSARAHEGQPMLERLKIFPACYDIVPFIDASIEPVENYYVDLYKEESFREEVENNLGRVYRCVEERNSTGAGSVQVSFTILPSGNLSQLNVAVRLSENDPKIGACIQNELAHTRIENRPNNEAHFKFIFAFKGASEVTF